MIKKLSLILALCLASQVHAGFDGEKYAAQASGDYDVDSGIYAQLVKANPADGENKSVMDSVSKSGDYDAPSINLFIYNPKDNTSRHLLDKNYGEITTFIMETAYENGSFHYLAGEQKVLNNANNAKRAINPNLLIQTYHSKTKTYTVWKANKLAGSAKVLFSYQTPSQWHVDAKNQVIRLVTPFTQNKQAQLKITNFAW